MKTNTVTNRWNELDDSVKAIYTNRQTENRSRYERELAAYEARVLQILGPAPANKKKKDDKYREAAARLLALQKLVAAEIEANGGSTVEEEDVGDKRVVEI